MRGTDHGMIFVDTDEHGSEVTVYMLRDTPLGLTEMDGKLDLSLLPSGADNPRQRLKEALVAVIEHL